MNCRVIGLVRASPLAYVQYILTVLRTPLGVASMGHSQAPKHHRVHSSRQTKQPHALATPCCAGVYALLHRRQRDDLEHLDI